MDRSPVTSGNLAEVGYDHNSETLEIMFRNGGVYQYYNFPNFMYERFIQSESLGKFFNVEIKGRFPETRI